ncbi:MAG: glycosyltransferase family 4 protein [Cyanophyceae cyanobacterium]
MAHSSLLINLSFAIPQPTGLSNYALSILPHLQSLEPTLLTPQNQEGFSCCFTQENMTAAHGAKGHLRRLIWTQFKLPQWYKRLDSRLLFCPIPEAPVKLPLLPNVCRTVVMAHDVIPLRVAPPRSRLHQYFRHYVPRVLHQAEHIICNSQATADDLIDFYKIPAPKLTPIPLAYDPDRYRPLGLQRQPFFVYLGRNDPYKNLSRAIAAFSDFLTQIPDADSWEFRLAGPIDERYHPTLLAQIHDLRLGDHVKVLGYVPDNQLPILLNQATALIFPSLWEGFGLPVLEALACGTPCIVSRRASLPEVAGNAALWIDPLRTETITTAMVELVQDAAVRETAQRLAIAQASKFSWKKTGQATAEILQQFM